MFFASCSKEDNEVKTKEITVESISIDTHDLNLLVGNTCKIKPIVLPENANDKTLIWKSSSEEVVKVDNGKITALKEGTAIISITSVNEKTCTCTIIVKKNLDVNIEVASIELKKMIISVEEEKRYQLKAIILPDNATNQTFRWITSNKEIATVDCNGLLTAVQAGKVNITVSSLNNKSAIFNVTVTPQGVAVESISFEKATYTINLGSSKKVVVNILPFNADNKKLIWKSSDNEILSVDEYARIYGNKRGSVKLKAISADSNIVSECTVTVI
jgi:uncharacterized protein YjdB